MSKQVFEGLKVADFSWNAVGPIMGSYLARHGATVVKIESWHRPDAMRGTPPFKDGIPEPDRAADYPWLNTGKYGVALNMTKPKAVEVAKRLAAWADVILDSFIPGTMKKWGLSYEQIRKFNPQIVMLSTCNQGQTGPHSHRPGFGTQLTALSGIIHLTGWPDRGPDFPFAAHTDFVAMRFGLAALLAALEYRERTGKGQYLDLSQYEASLHLLSPLVLDYNVNGRVAKRMGNRSNYAVPHGAFPCRGDDRWCAIAISDDGQWHAFCQVIGEPAWTKDARFVTVLGRKQNEDELEALVSSWTVSVTAEQAMEKLQCAGVSAGVVQNGRDMNNDPQLEGRGSYEFLEHPVLGIHRYNYPSFRLSKTPSQIRRGHCLGEHNEYVFTHLLGMSDEEFTTLLGEGVFE